MSDFHALHAAGAPLLLPNAWDHTSAAALAEAGFAAIGTTSLGVAAVHGVPDGSGGTKQETFDLARKIVALPVPITVDVEAGFGLGPAEIGDFAAALADLGVAGINIEDELCDPQLHARRITEIRDRAPGLFVNARTDTHWLGSDPSLPEALERARRYAGAGADGVFVPGLSAETDVRALVEAVDVPVNVLYKPGQSIEELAAAGVHRISTGSLLYRAALSAAVTTAREIRSGGATAADAPTYQAVQDYIVGGRRRGSGGLK
ncbi:isocitrate lyase/phosphoenolpyruvate mutase family protein [Saccharopolyspora rhizosphaerae]|uniref:Isocitrate lyase/phosphoenolpyruvate mutase family protein n=1 Tax=Saccharopolyspora rhizosphaerae TaxID=2492662 RepID=A0A426JQD8_9PSEU|nr:isocitrate lyase/phosphoenolpyruvate mutase family protein [Saccharopolyspora rhizosphaerae]RRO15413.1 isocitrate lyase/phosphoenolpyruvate mutase family protein [Saccharopolyspora rhizosphaerae]